jgi:hypothetical protein
VSSLNRNRCPVYSGFAGKRINESDRVEEVINILIWHGFLGIHNDNKDPIYIFNSNYNMKIISSLSEKKRSDKDLAYVINPAFWPALIY